MKTFVVGDIHGAYQALLQCFKRSGFDYEKDRLIVLGDVCDRYPEIRQTFDELLKIKHCDYIIGNHDLWALAWAVEGKREDIWLKQEGRTTIESYGNQPMPQAHIDFLKSAPYWLEYKDKIFVHGGFNPEKPIAVQDKTELAWDRSLIHQAYQINKISPNYQFSDYNEIYLGHTPTQHFNSMQPLKLCNVWALDTGAGWAGKLTIMDVDIKQYWQSDPTPELYPGVAGRKR